MNEELKKQTEHLDRSCDALVLAYDPTQVLKADFSRKFYIPGCSHVEKAFGYALREIFGTQNGTSHWTDSVKWPTVANIDKLEKRILEGTREAICGDSDYQRRFNIYLFDLSGLFEHTWTSMMGEFYRFRDGRRKQALSQFGDYWNEQEKRRWGEIHKLMREYTQKNLKRKKFIYN